MRLCSVFIVILITNGCCGRNNNSARQLSNKSNTAKTADSITIPIIIHLDRALIDKLADESKIKMLNRKELTRSVLKKAEAYFHHTSLNQNIKLSLVDTRVLRKSKLEMNENGSEYLKDYCTWQATMKQNNNSMWYSILLTGLDVYYLDGEGNKVRTSTGRGYMGGICAVTKSCAVIEWDSYSIDYLIAHEIGHSLGINHDGQPNNECKPNYYVMGNKYNPLYPPKVWSECSKRYLEKFMGNKKSRCLKKPPEYQNRRRG